jgi:hypothetical protein
LLAYEEKGMTMVSQHLVVLLSWEPSSKLPEGQRLKSYDVARTGWTPPHDVSDREGEEGV